MKFIIELMMTFSFASLAQTPFYNCFANIGEGIVYTMPATEMERVLRDEIGYTSDPNLGGIQLGPDSLLVIEQDRDDDDIMVGTAQMEQRIYVEIQTESLGWIKAACSYINN